MLTVGTPVQAGGGTSVLTLAAVPAAIAEVFGLGGVGETQSDEEVAGRIVTRRAGSARTDLSWQPTGGPRASRRAAFEEDSGVLKPTRAQKKNVIAFCGCGKMRVVEALTLPSTDSGSANVRRSSYGTTVIVGRNV